MIVNYSAFKVNFISTDLFQSIDFAYRYNQAEAKKTVTNLEEY